MQTEPPTVTLALVALCLSSMLVAAPAFHESDRPPLRVSGVEVGVAAESTEFSALTLRVHNEGRRAISPVVGVASECRQTNSYWNVVSGPARLAPGANETYVVRPDHPAFGLCPGTEFVVSVNDRDGELISRVGPLSAPETTRNTTTGSLDCSPCPGHCLVEDLE